MTHKQTNSGVSLLLRSTPPSKLKAFPQLSEQTNRCFRPNFAAATRLDPCFSVSLNRTLSVQLPFNLLGSLQQNSLPESELHINLFLLLHFGRKDVKNARKRHDFDFLIAALRKIVVIAQRKTSSAVVGNVQAHDRTILGDRELFIVSLESEAVQICIHREEGFQNNAPSVPEIVNGGEVKQKGVERSDLLESIHHSSVHSETEVIEKRLLLG